MENNMNISREELARLVEEAEKQAQATLEKLTPEERRRVDAEMQKRIAEDAAAMQKLIDGAAKATVGASMNDIAQPKFCRNCGAKAEGGKFCTYCGSLL